jgi:exopolyphosphatase/pppGpp-phosphohydrolase
METRAHNPARAIARPAFAALDLGTNNGSLRIAAPTTSGFRALDSFSRVVRLGEGLHESGQRRASGMDCAMPALQTRAGSSIFTADGVEVMSTAMNRRPATRRSRLGRFARSR